MTTTRIDRIRTLLKGIETGDPDAVSVISPTRYIQHNPQTQTGREGLAALFARLSKTSPRVNIVRAFADGDFVFGHTEYDFASRRIGFEVFRFEGDSAVEHWDNIQPREGPNPSGHSMVDGPAEASDLDHTEANRDLVRAFVERVRIGELLHRVQTPYGSVGFRGDPNSGLAGGGRRGGPGDSWGPGRGRGLAWRDGPPWCRASSSRLEIELVEAPSPQARPPGGGRLAPCP